MSCSAVWPVKSAVPVGTVGPSQQVILSGASSVVISPGNEWDGEWLQKVYFLLLFLFTVPSGERKPLQTVGFASSLFSSKQQK